MRGRTSDDALGEAYRDSRSCNLATRDEHLVSQGCCGRAPYAGRDRCAFEWDAKARKSKFKVLLSLGPRPDYSGEYLCIDTGIEPSTYAALSSAALVDKITKGSVPHPICPVRLNKMPILFPLNDPPILIFSSLQFSKFGSLGPSGWRRVIAPWKPPLLRTGTGSGFRSCRRATISEASSAAPDALRMRHFHRADPEGSCSL